MLELGLIGFLNPWLLLGLLSFPALWLLLRITPPAPRKVFFPPLRLLMGLKGTNAKPLKTVWWLILLRSLILLLIILALADPVYAPDKRPTTNQTTLILLDNGWSAATSWQNQINRLRQILDHIEATNTKVAVLFTAANTDGSFEFTGFQNVENLLATIPHFPPPRGWEADQYSALLSIETTLKKEAPIQISWLSSGLQTSDPDNILQNHLTSLGEVSLYAPSTVSLPLWIETVAPEGSGLSVQLARLPSDLSDERIVTALSRNNEVLASQTLVLAAGATEGTTQLTLPNELHNRIHKISISGVETAATQYLMDRSNWRFPVGLLNSGGAVDDSTLLGEHYYLNRALGLFTDVRDGPLEQLFSRELSAIVVTDEEVIVPAEEATLQNWVEQGGLLLRFAGPNLATQRDSLLPVPLRSGYRNLAGSLTWEQPLAIKDFAANSPLTGLKIPPDVTVSGQLLAQPTPELEQQTWASLLDGTPLITAQTRGKGHIVLIHTTANTRWSNLVLSGLFVEMLERILEYGQGVISPEERGAELPLHDMMDAYGALTPAQNSNLSIPIASRNVTATPGTPPGFYGRNEPEKAVNLAGSIRPQQAVTAAGQDKIIYGDRQESPLQIPLLLCALLLFLLDQSLSLWLRGLIGMRGVRKSIVSVSFLLLLTMVAPPPLLAQSEPLDPKAIEATLGTYLAFVITGDLEVDRNSQAGLEGLSRQLHRRTAVENVQVTGIDLDLNQLSPYPLLYWPVTPSQPLLSIAAKRRLNLYIQNGGLILFDLREATAILNSAIGSAGNNRHLLRLTKEIAIPDLELIPPDHVLTRSFYLLESFPGHHNNRDLWAEKTDRYRHDGVARILVGSNEWAKAWAMTPEGFPLYPMIRGGERQRELAYRFGINLVMYALTGNYKEDQVHIPHILERLGQ
ncbi:DUF4159 domain-containing protein [Kiloniella laminariae]|uniref:DUF4159 domain-containing protein n=1 Tax=Kiloniella laminariae TaxID=454162 RepID=A0ABT4LL87_9PROT|nr:DUF4159 domain-containing protein [Kiloniella laminariae]MCZ4281841.1 DUF4159 domain-containing protein [Kiloniella laminariae]